MDLFLIQKSGKKEPLLLQSIFSKQAEVPLTIYFRPGFFYYFILFVFFKVGKKFRNFRNSEKIPEIPFRKKKDSEFPEKFRKKKLRKFPEYSVIKNFGISRKIPEKKITEISGKFRNFSEISGNFF